MYLSRLRTILPAIYLLCLFSCLPKQLQARQERPNTVEFWGGMAGWSGEKAEGFSEGPATGATFLFDIGVPVQLGLDAAFARMDSDQSVGEVDEFALSLVARYRFMAVPRVGAFVGVLAGYTRLSADYETLRFEQNGGLVGGNAGFEIPLGSRIMLVGTGVACYYGYGDTTVFLYDMPIQSSGGNAWRYSFRLGLSFRWRY